MSTILNLVDRHEFTKLFVEELGWDRPDAHKTWTPPTSGEDYTLTQVASFSGLRVWHCPKLPDRSVQRGIDNELSKTNAERLVIFSDGTYQEWRWPRHRQLGGVNAKLMVHPHTVGESDHNLESRLQAIELGIDEDITLTQLLSRMRVAFDVESETASQQAARLMGTLYEHLNMAGMEPTQATLLLSRLLFLFFGDDTDMWRPDAFRDWVAEHVPADQVSIKLGELFGVLDDPQADNGTANAKPWTLDEQYRGFRYINGGLFAETLNIPPLDETFRHEILEACKFDWSVISPAVFGSMFQTVKDAKARREFGEHYTTETNIQRLIRPLFLDELEERLDRAWDSKAELTKLHSHLGELRFLDPACGCGNFLVVTYRELRALELRLLKRREELDVLDGRSSGQNRAQSAIQLEGATEVKVGLDHFFGIELEDWPARIAQTAMLLVDHQANQAMSEEFGTAPARLPIRVSASIQRGNALRIDWELLVSPSKDTYILGNPPFLGDHTRDVDQLQDLQDVWGVSKVLSRLDYVTGWYKKAIDYYSDQDGQWAFVSTNSIVQGDQTARLFGPIFSKGWKIKFAHRTFAWESEAPEAAAVHCVIIGFTRNRSIIPRLFDYPNWRGKPNEIFAKAINAYLVDGPDVLVEKRSRPVGPNIPKVNYGSKPADGGNFVIKAQEYSIIQADPIMAKYLRPFVGSDELLYGRDRWCLWLKDMDPEDIGKSSELERRVEAVKQMRLASKAPSTREYAKFPRLFRQYGFMSDVPFIGIPEVSSEGRRYLPVAYLPAGTIISNKVYGAVDDGGILFGVVSSSMFITWMKTVGGRLESRLSFSSTITWNNFPLPSLTETQKASIVKAGEGVQSARNVHPERNLAEHYNALSMDPRLIQAHDKLDAVVDEVFGATQTCAGEEERQELLFARYVDLEGVAR
ncbi:class I SAM-dependent DNA methyltransferase [Kocuria rosea]|uniref:site-specific DNA-methyltransferase (adenine-specific) n=1 Tax=Kocuria rosea TaxID=1275 RepID=A0A4R5YMW8_KOCRO|nr:DNA methyltransferase [Kocuria rosea]TDL44664.1 class I SAM-dependent DNA methyltransferase [Kocuria rosea]